MSWTHLRDRHPEARKPYVCVLCELTIAAGERYVRRVGVLDGDMLTSHMHEACEAATRDWDEDDWETIDSAKFRAEVLGLRLEAG